MELVDEPAGVVAPLLQGYADVAAGRRSAADLWAFLQTLPDSNGRAQGVTRGSLATRAEVARSAMKQTAAAGREERRQVRAKR